MMLSSARGRTGFGWGRSGGSTKRSSTSGNPGAYRNCKTQFANKVNSYKMLINQTEGPAKFGRPSPTTLNSFANWINKGAIVRTITPGQVAKWAKATNRNFSNQNAGTAACKNVLCKKFGKSSIKAVARTKSGQFMVAFSPAIGGRVLAQTK
jgi:hypothetical protein